MSHISYKTFEEGEVAYAYLSGHNGTRSEVRVEKVVYVDGWALPQYIISYYSPVDCHLDLRDGWSLWKTAN